MKRIGPPSWMECLLLSLLPVRDRETVTGDLFEEFCNRRASGQSLMRASVWYLLQAVSFAPSRCRSAFIQPRMLALLCAFTASYGCWFGVMDLRLRHLGSEGFAIAAEILLQSLLTLAALYFRRNSLFRCMSMLGCLVLFWLAGKVLIATVHGAQLEGYVLLMAVALIYQASLTLCTLPASDGSGKLV